MRKNYVNFKVLVSVLLLCLISIHAAAKPITREQARQKVLAFQTRQGDSRQIKAVVSTKRLAPRKASAQQGFEPYYVFDRGDNEGFVIASGDDQTIDVLGYTDNGTFDFEQLPPQLQDLLNDYARQIEAIAAGARVAKIPANHPKVETFMGCKWSQGSPYNDLCPLDAGRRSVTGCVATAMAQILYYNREKSVTETTAAIPGYTSWTKSLSVPGIAAGSPIDWDNMKDTYNSATDRQKKAVAQLMLYCGVAVEMDYTNGASGAQIYMVADACKKYFGYGNSVKYINSFSSEDEMDKIVYNELAAGRPVYLGGYNTEVGHAFLTCGYENQRYWINWGWGGQSDGYYYLTNLTPGDGQGIGGSADGYNSGKTCIIGLEPENFGQKAMSFADAAVKKTCIEKWDSDGDGKLTYDEAAAVTSIGDAFKGNASLKKFPELYYFTSVTALPDDAFNGCKALATLRLPKTLKSVGARAFKDCQKLTQINLPTSVNSIGEEAFAGCSLLSSFELSNELTAIEKGTFKNCPYITSIDLPISISRIGDEAFTGCTRLGSFTVNSYHPDDIVLGSSVFSSIDLSKAVLHVMQGTKSYFTTTDQWKDFGKIVQTRDISGGQFTAPEANGTYYLYNVGTGRYLTKGEAYKTQAVVDTDPMRFKLLHNSAKPEGVYTFSSPDTGNDGKYLFRTSTDDNVGSGVKATFVDGTNLTGAYWKVAPVGNNIYTIQVPEGDNGYVAGQFLGVQTDHQSNAASPTYGAYWDVDYESHKLNCQWQFVLYDENNAEKFAQAEALGKLLSTAKKRNVRCESEQAAYDNLDSTLDELELAISSLRKKLKFMEFYHKEARAKIVDYFDTDTDGELSYKEASEVKDFGWLFNFMNSTWLVRLDELQYFTSATSIHGNFAQNCTNLESIILPKGLEKIYYWAFKGCRKLKAINIPDYVNEIGDEVFQGCTSLREVTIGVPNPSTIKMGEDIFSGVPLANCTLYVPFGTKELYAQADVWKDFGNIVEVRPIHSTPKFSPIAADKPGYIYHIGTRKMLTMGEAYGTQSVVAHKGRLYQLKRTASMAEGVYYLCDNKTENVVFRTNTDKNVGQGVKACFGDGDLSTKAYWKFDVADGNIFTLQVPSTDANYVEGEFLGVDERHESDYAKNNIGYTYGIYWDMAAGSASTQWGFVSEDDYKAAQDFDNIVEKLSKNLKTAKEQNIEVTEEQAAYDNPESTMQDLMAALTSVRAKLHFITFADSRAQTLCLDNWDANADGELSFEEAALVTNLSDVFRGSNIVNFEELRYFTSLTSIPENAFRNATSLQVIYLPKSVTSLGDYCFMACSELAYVVMLNDQQVVPAGYSNISSKTTLFVPGSVMEAYKTDAVWAEKCPIAEFTGLPVVSAEASRPYGRSSAPIKMTITGAPIVGTPEFSCEQTSVATTPVGTYPIKVKPGSVITLNVEYRDGVFTVEPAALTITAKSYTREIGQSNPEFEITYKGWRNRETEEVLIARPVVSCEATPQSPAGEYDIVVSGAEAQNYAITYVPGKLTVIDPDGIETVKSDTDNSTYYDMQGRRVSKPQRGLYIQRNKKIIVK